MYASNSTKSALLTQASDRTAADILAAQSEEAVVRSVALASLEAIPAKAAADTPRIGASTSEDESAALRAPAAAVANNNVPVWSGLDPVEIIEDGPPVATFANATIFDLDLDVLNGGLGDYKDAWIGFFGGVLTVVSLVPNESFTIEQSTSADVFILKHGGHAFARYSIVTDPRSSGSVSHYVHFTSEDTASTSALVNDVIRSVHLEYRYDAPGPATGDTIVFGDAAGFDRNIAFGTVQVNITAVNDAPTNIVPQSQFIASNTDLVFSAPNGNRLIVGDPDTPADFPDQGTLEVTIAALHGSLTLASPAGLSFSSGDGTADATMTFRGTIAAINTALDGLAYRSDAGYSGQDIVTVTTNDLGATGVGGVLTDRDSFTINVAAQLDLVGDASNESLFGTESADRFQVQQGGEDRVEGRGGDDLFAFGAEWSAGDSVLGGTGFDTLQLAGDYDFTFGEDQISGVERLLLIGGSREVSFDYRLKMADGNVAPWERLIVDASDLVRTETLNFDGGALPNMPPSSYEVIGGFGADTISGGRGNDRLSGGNGDDRLDGASGDDVLIGGLGADLMKGIAGDSIYFYTSAAESTTTRFDTIEGFWNRGYGDLIDLPFEVSGWTGNVTAGALSFATFGTDLRRAVDGALESHSAVLFTPNSGDYAGRTFVVIDGDGDGSYAAVQDYVIEFASPEFPISTTVDIFI
ncbi:calcium-binding protein [Sphingosinicella sp. BN140058]|uniref:calcium-binding protein n=1 Tax=Sphingosinicella sp. BN140058 TaxID=1892855 RepID=UPI001013AF27|nr:calcium-binding protein [Sphingosinicella sp. BN140058]QAY77976.1 calcium-binding protein [Sphingosinicella sp. BN140058]